MAFATLKRECDAATELGMVKRARRARILVQQDAARGEGHVVCSAKELADKIPDNLDSCWQVLDHRFVEAGVPEMAMKTATPMTTIKALGAACSLGKDVASLLYEAADLTVLERKGGSLMSLRSAVRAWNAFAFEVLNYPMEKTFPPVEGRHLEAFGEIFKNVGSALNYVGHVIFAATWARCDMRFNDCHFKAWQLGMRKKKTSRNDVVKHASFLLTSSMVNQLVQFFDAIMDDEAAMLTVQCWQEFLRVQSEGVDAMAGDQSQALALEDGVDSAVWVDSQGCACHRMAKRKNRPKGSILRRPCTCGEDKIICLPCRLGKFIQRRSKGQRLYNMNSYDFTKRLKEALRSLGYENVEKFTLKAFRAGHATELACLGVDLAKIMEKGEWSSRAIFSYINMEQVDQSVLLHKLTEHDDE